ncbi:MAG: Hsp20/alpha crystallin family protein [Thermodesulfobacteriota bacterium]
MQLTKRSPRKDVDNFFENLFDEPFKRFIHERFPKYETLSRMQLISPLLDMYEKKDEIVVRAELPGIDKDKINISVSEGVLTLKGEVNKEEEVKDEDYYYSERSFGSFARSISLPSKVKENKIDANYKDGILEITLPKSPEAKSNEIKVKVK